MSTAEDAQKEARRWLSAAREDLAYAKHAASGGFPVAKILSAAEAAQGS